MANQWFRMYAEFTADPKVQMLSEIDQRRYVMLLCIRCGNDDETFHDEAIAFQLRVSLDEWNKTKSILLARNLIDLNNHPTSWNKRQYQSDVSTERVRKHREHKKLSCNVSETPPDQNRPEQIQTRTDHKNGHSNNLGLEVGFVVDMETADKLLSIAPGWDQHRLIKLYNDWRRGKERPDNPQAAFLGWAKKFTKGQHPH